MAAGIGSFVVCSRLEPHELEECKDLISRVALGGEALSMYQLT